MHEYNHCAAARSQKSKKATARSHQLYVVRFPVHATDACGCSALPLAEPVSTPLTTRAANATGPRDFSTTRLATTTRLRSTCTADVTGDPATTEHRQFPPLTPVPPAPPLREHELSCETSAPQQHSSHESPHPQASRATCARCETRPPAASSRAICSRSDSHGANIACITSTSDSRILVTTDYSPPGPSRSLALGPVATLTQLRKHPRRHLRHSLARIARRLPQRLHRHWLSHPALRHQQPLGLLYHPPILQPPP